MTRRSQLSMNTAVLVAAMIGLALVGAVSGQKPDPSSAVPLPVREQNLDANGAIRVHEQGTANVNVTNQALSISGSVSVDNFPTEMNVNVTGGSLLLAPATRAFIRNLLVQPGVQQQFLFPTTIYATTITVWATADEEIQVSFQGPFPFAEDGVFETGTVLFLDDSEAKGIFDNPGQMRSFSQPIPLHAVTIHCANESETCGVFVAVVGS